jgi:hypothetical protein
VRYVLHRGRAGERVKVHADAGVPAAAAEETGQIIREEGGTYAGCEGVATAPEGARRAIATCMEAFDRLTAKGADEPMPGAHQVLEVEHQAPGRTGRDADQHGSLPLLWRED